MSMQETIVKFSFRPRKTNEWQRPFPQSSRRWK